MRIKNLVPSITLAIALMSFPTSRAADSASSLSLPGSPGKAATLVNNASIASLVNDNDASIGFGDRYIVVFIDYGVKNERNQILALLQFSQRHPEYKIVIKELPLVSTEAIDIGLAQAAVVMQQNELGWRIFESSVLSSKQTITLPLLRTFVQSAGLDVEHYDSALHNGQALSKLKDNRNIAQALHVDGTPFFVREGKISKGLLNYTGLIDFISD